MTAETWRTLKNYEIARDDFTVGICEYCHEESTVTHVLLDPGLRERFSDLDEDDQEDLYEEAKEENLEMPDPQERVFVPLGGPTLSSELCAKCLAELVQASAFRLCVGNPDEETVRDIKTI